MIKFSRKIYLQFLFFLSILTLSSALIIEYIFGYQPCNLCEIERIPYMLSIIIIITNYYFRRDQIFYSILLMLVFAFSIIISFYHFGIEQGFIKESAFCAAENLDLLTKEDVLNSFDNLNISCKNVAFKVFNLSLTTYNILISLLMFLVSTKIYLISDDIKK